MIVVKLKGGMGNQMFQYALGRRLSYDLDTELKLDITGFEKPTTRWDPRLKNPYNTVRHFSLYHFNIGENYATEEEVARIAYPWGIFSKLAKIFEEKILRRFHIGFEPIVLKKILKKRGDIYIDGLWHNEKYFEPIEHIIREEFTLKKSLSPEAQKIADELESLAKENSTVALHVRRGDFADDPASLKYHGLMTTEYYGGAIQLLKSKLREIKIYIFSDDIEWVKKNIPFGDSHVYVSGPAIPFHQEIALMSMCSHQIIANSSFSWWGAWLNRNPQKIVVAPKKWLAKTGNDYYEEIPEEWIKI